MVPSTWEVPAFSCNELQPRRSRYAVCVFILNEGERFLTQLDRMQPFAGTADVIVADGGSSDGATALGRLRDLGVSTLLVKTGPGQLSAQMRMALAYCCKRGYDGVIVMDGNNK